MADPQNTPAPLPPRHPWEEPPPAGWSSSLPDVGKELALFAGSGALAFACVRLVHVARRMGEHAHGFTLVVDVAIWLCVCVVVAMLSFYVWRRLGGVGVVTAMLTDHGRLRRMGGRPPVWLDTPPPDGLRVAHLSDLHVNEGPEVRMVERAHPGGNVQLERLLDSPALDDAELVLVTGDVTDRGTSVSWRHFLDAIEDRGLADRVVLVPGNHDIAFVEHIERRHDALRLDRFAIVQLANLLKFHEAFAATMGGKRGVCIVGGEPRAFTDAWHDVEEAVRPLVASLPTTPVPPLTLRHWLAQKHDFFAYVEKIEAARARLLELFPVAVPLPDRDACVFVLNSVSRVSRHPALNAIGRIGRAQYKRLDKLARQMPQKLKLVAVHHHLVRRGEEQSAKFVHRLFAKFTVLGDAAPLVKFCNRYAVRAVLNGHRHLSYQLRLPSGTVLLAAPSSTLGDELSHDRRPQFERYDFQLQPDVETVGIHRASVRLSREATPVPVVAATSRSS